MEYTKGEWKIISGFKIRCGEEQCFVADCWTGDLYFPRPRFIEAEANAHLISAAPELYEALKEFMEVLEKVGSEYPAIRIAYNLAKPALAKAEGK